VACRTPFSRHRHRDVREGSSAAERLARAYEFAVSEWKWTHDYIEGELTDALFVWYLDAAVDRVESATRWSFESAVETARLGYIYARDQKQYRRWRSDQKALHPERSQPGLTGMALEQHIATLHRSRPDLVAMRA
jgi:hypothetical protein